MSFREIRNFTEIMRALGYPRLISMENFRSPNFELVADILYWMVKLYDPETNISDRVEFENERVEFLTGIAALLANKARLKLNTKKLYASDGKAVQELLKIATLLYNASKTVSKKVSTEEESTPPPIKVQDVKFARGLASEITQSGAKLYDLLENESAERTERARALRFLDQAATSAEGSKDQVFVERKIREIIENTKQTVEDMTKECEELDADKKNLESKIVKKQEELERTEKRLKSLENVKPQFMEEAEKLEKELQRYYEIYMEKHRNLDYLEFELEKYRKFEEEQMQEQDRKLKKMRERLLKEEVDLMRGGNAAGSGSIINARDDYEEPPYNRRADAGPRGNGEKASESRNRHAQISGQMNRDSDRDSSDVSESNDDDRRYRNRRGVAESDDEELSVNEKVQQQQRRAGGGGGMRGNASNKVSNAGSTGRGGGLRGRDDDHGSDDFLDDDDDDEEEEGDEDDDGDEGEFSENDDF